MGFSGHWGGGGSDRCSVIGDGCRVFREVWEWKAAVSVLPDLLWFPTGR